MRAAASTAAASKLTVAFSVARLTVGRHAGPLLEGAVDAGDAGGAGHAADADRQRLDRGWSGVGCCGGSLRFSSHVFRMATLRSPLRLRPSCIPAPRPLANAGRSFAVC